MGKWGVVAVVGKASAICIGKIRCAPKEISHLIHSNAH